MIATRRNPVWLSLLVLLWALAAPAQEAPVRIRVELEGLNPDLAAAVREALDIYQFRREPDLDEDSVRRLHRRAPEQIGRALEAAGYYHAEIEPQLQRGATGWQARYPIALGAPVRIEALSIQLRGPGANDPALEKWRTAFPLAEGQIFVHHAYEEGKQQARRVAHERGYFEADFPVHRAVVDPARNRARIELVFATGPRYRFGEVTFQQDFLEPGLLRRFVGFVPGEPYDANRLLALQRDLTDSDYFERVYARPLVEEARHGDTDRVPIRVELVPNQRSRYTAGVGYSTNIGPRVSAGLERRYVNRRGHKTQAEARLSPVQSKLEAQYWVPLKDPAREGLTTSVGYIDEDTDTVERQTYAIGVERVRRLGLWRNRLGLTFEIEDYDVGSDEGRSQLLVPHVGWERVQARTRIHPERGWRLALELRGAAEAAASDVSFLQLRLGGKYITSLSAPGRLLVRADLGLSWVPEFQQLPPSQRFFAGGDDSVRGFEFESLGPRDDQGVVVGGRHLLVASAEYEYPFRPDWAIAAFYDVGNAFNDTDFELEHGSGVGLRWRLPFGSLRADVAWALSQADDPVRFHLTLGTDL